MPDLGVIGETLLHVLWQGSAIGLVAGAALMACRSAQAKYTCACVALASIPAAAAATFMVLLSQSTSAPFASVMATTLEASSTTNALAWAWACGCVLMATRLALQWACAHRLRRCAMAEVDRAGLTLFESLRRQMGVGRVRLLSSALTRTPMVIGWASPIVLVPVGAFTSLTPDQLKAVLAHELAHVRRYDHVVNAVQSLIEIVLFFHPVVWWLSWRIRLEREHCCDDIAVGTTGNPIVLAKALAELESLRETYPQIALAANGGTLMHRIKRILGVGATTRTISLRSISGIAAAIVAAGVGISHADITPPDAMSQALGDAVSMGVLDEAQARSLWALHVYSGSDQKAKIVAEADAARARIAANVAAGRLSDTDAEASLGKIDAHLAALETMAFAMDVRGMSREEAKFFLLENRIHEQVKAGEMTAEEGTRKIKKIAEHKAQREQIDLHVEEIHREIAAAVAAGDLTKEQAQLKLHGALRKIEEKASIHEHMQKLDVEELHAKLAAAVESGRISEEEARLKLHEMMRIAEDAAAIHEHNKKLHVELIHEKIAAAVEAGIITKDEARAKLDAMLHQVESNKAQLAHESLHNDELELRLMHERRLEHQRQVHATAIVDIVERLKKHEITTQEAHAVIVKLLAEVKASKEGDK